MGVQAKNFAKIGYVFHQVFWILVSLLLMVSAKKLVSWFPGGMIDCPGASGGESSCLGASAIIRMSFALAIFHTFILLIILTRSQMAALFHDGCWCVKIMIVSAVFTGSMWISNDFMKGYLQFTKYLSAVFLGYQAILMLTVAYSFNARLVSNFLKDTTKCSQIILILVTLSFFVLNVW